MRPARNAPCDPVIMMAEGTVLAAGTMTNMRARAMGRVLIVEGTMFLVDEETANLASQVATDLLTGHVRALAEVGAAVLVVEQRTRAVLVISDCSCVPGGVMAHTPARQATESFLGAGPKPS